MLLYMLIPAVVCPTHGENTSQISTQSKPEFTFSETSAFPLNKCPHVDQYTLVGGEVGSVVV